jgi:hypothetical protein
MSLNRTLIDVIIRQTDYTEEKAIEKLTEHKNDVIAIVREYMGVVKPPTRNEVVKSSTNQQIFSEIRNLMDDAAKNYQAKKAYEKRKEQYIAYMQAKQKEAKQKEAQYSNANAVDTNAVDTNANAVETNANEVVLEEAVIAVL